MGADILSASRDAGMTELLGRVERLSLIPRRAIEDGRPPLAVVELIADAQAALDDLRVALVARAAERLLGSARPADMDELIRLLARAERRAR